jgi:hypothetical protein
MTTKLCFYWVFVIKIPFSLLFLLLYQATNKKSTKKRRFAPQISIIFSVRLQTHGAAPQNGP